MSTARSHAPTAKGERTRAQILEAALALFAERGWDGTTMRAVAERAGVSVGSAYYYFASKEHLIQGFYRRSHEEHLAACQPILARETDFQKRLVQVARKKIELSQPYHQFAGQLFKTAADPNSPLNPFSSESEPTRDQARALMAEVVRGARLRVPADLAQALPELLWLWEMAVILFWVHDRSPGCARTFRLVDRTAELVARLVALASNPLLAPLRKTTLRLLAELREVAGASESDPAPG